MNCKRQVKGKTSSRGTNYGKRDSKSLYCLQMFWKQSFLQNLGGG